MLMMCAETWLSLPQIQVFVPQNGVVPFIITEANEFTISSPWPCTQVVTLAATVGGQRVSASVLFSTVFDTAAILSSRTPLPADAVWGPRAITAHPRPREPEADLATGRNSNADGQRALSTEELDGTEAARQRSEFAVLTRGARPISLVFVGTLKLDGQKHIWLEQMERLSRGRFSSKYLTFRTMRDVDDENYASIFIDATGAADWEKNGTDKFARRLSHAGVQLITAQLPPVDVRWIPESSDGQLSISSMKEVLFRMVLDSYDRAAGDPHTMSPAWTRNIFLSVADAVKYASPDVLVIANGNTFGDVVLTKAARWAMGKSGCKIVMDFPNLGSAVGVDVDVLAAPSHYVSRHPDTQALAVAAGVHVVVMPPGVRGGSSDILPIQPLTASGIPSREVSEGLIHELARADGILDGMDCWHPACPVRRIIIDSI